MENIMTSSEKTVSYIAKKVLQLIVSLIILSLIVFFVSRLAPGDPLRAYYGESVERMTAEQLQNAEHRLGLDRSLPVQYLTWAGNALRGDLGISYQYKQPVTDVIGSVIGNTVLLTAVSFLLIAVLGLMLAIFCVRREGSTADRLICRAGVAANSIPEFFMALILILVFAVKLGVLPQSGVTSIGGGGAADRLLHLILPVAAIVISHIWYCAYLMRNRLSDEMSREYVLMCKVKGLTEHQIIYRHCVRNIMPSVVSIMAVFLPHLLGGAYVIEMVFSYPGIGRLGLESAQYHDYNLLMTVCLITGASVMIVNMVAQVINEKLSPDMKEERGQML